MHMIQSPYFQTTAQSIHAANARHDLEMEPRDSFVPTYAEVIPHGVPESGFCKWQFVMEMADGTTYSFPSSVQE